jgi:hypothetical protein
MKSTVLWLTMAAAASAQWPLLTEAEDARMVASNSPHRLVDLSHTVEDGMVT